MEYAKLLILVAPLIVLILGARAVLRGYDPDGDKCPHGVTGGEGFKCAACESIARDDEEAA